MTGPTLRIRLFAFAVTLSLTATAAADHPPTRAVERGVDYLLPRTAEKLATIRKQLERSSSLSPTAETGAFVLSVYALTVAGVSVESPTIRRALTELNALEFSGTHATYVTSCYVFALDAVLTQIETDRHLLATGKRERRWRVARHITDRLEEAVTALVERQHKSGGWHYDSGDQTDNSNTQFAVLALGVGAKRGVEIPRDVWRSISEHFIVEQEQKGPRTKKKPLFEEYTRDWGGIRVKSSEGRKKRSKPRRRRARGWKYRRDSNASFQMTCAGLSSLILVRQNLFGGSAPEPSRDPKKARELRALNRSIDDGYGWLMEHWQPPGDRLYNMYSLEKVGDLGGVRKFDTHDWHAELERHLISSQNDDGSWSGKGPHEPESPEIPTAFALLILNRATTLMTLEPLRRVVVSGRSTRDKGEDGKQWVYVPRLDGRVHFPTLVLSTRLRPSTGMFDLLEEAVEHHPDHKKGELLPELILAHRKAKRRGPRRRFESHLVHITGERFRDNREYKEWYDRWLHVHRLEEAGEASGVPKLLEYYRRAKRSVRMRVTVMWALMRLKAREAIPYFLDDLDHKNVVVRQAAYSNFKAFFLDFPPRFDATEKPSVRRAQIAAIRDWYEARKDAK